MYDSGSHTVPADMLFVIPAKPVFSLSQYIFFIMQILILSSFSVLSCFVLFTQEGTLTQIVPQLLFPQLFQDISRQIVVK